IDIFLIPERLKDTVCKTKCQEILYRFFAHVVVYTVDLIFTEDAPKCAIELLRRSKITPKGFLNDDTRPGFFLTSVAAIVVLWTSKTRASKLMNHLDIEGGRR